MTAIDGMLSTRSVTRINVLVRNRRAERALENYLAHLWGVEIPEIRLLGIHVLADRDVASMPCADAVVVHGIRGPRTIDAVMASRPMYVSLVLDPIEARTLCALVRPQIALLGPSEVARTAKQALQGIHDAAYAMSAPYAKVLEIDATPERLSVVPLDLEGVAAALTREDAGARETATLTFADGTIAVVARNRAFDVLRDGSLRLATVQAHDLRPGDLVIVLEAGSQRLFSERLLEALDETSLRGLVQERRTWSSLITAQAKIRRLRVTDIHKALEQAGIH
ncbi:MAG TPA: hypothetical protein VKX16_07795, partial [Chloroflexota bacterium]|nr:hypothetical protein [Chloroflexota bacterium]